MRLKSLMRQSRETNPFTKVFHLISDKTCRDPVDGEITFINDPSLFSHHTHGTNVCNILSSYSPKFKWVCGMRVDNINEEVLVKLIDAGCVGICFGVETGTQSVLMIYSIKDLLILQPRNGHLCT